LNTVSKMRFSHSLALEPTPSSLRCAAASGRGSPPAFGCTKEHSMSKKETPMRLSPVGLVATLALAIFVAPRAAHAQPPGKVFRVGVLTPTDVAFSGVFPRFKQRLQELGYVEGQNLALEVRGAEGQFERLPGLAAELVRLNVDVIVTLGGTTRIA